MAVVDSVTQFCRRAALADEGARYAAVRKCARAYRGQVEPIDSSSTRLDILGGMLDSTRLMQRKEQRST